MTKPMEYDHVPLELQECERRFFAVLIADRTVETADENINVTYQRGIYSFETKAKRDGFTKVCNADAEDTIAFRFSRKPTDRRLIP